MADIRNGRKFRDIAADLRDKCTADGVFLVAGETEDLLATSVSDIAGPLGVTEGRCWTGTSAR